VEQTTKRLATRDGWGTKERAFMIVSGRERKIKKERGGCVDSTYPMSDRSKNGKGCRMPTRLLEKANVGQEGEGRGKGSLYCTFYPFEVFKGCWRGNKE